MADGTQRGFNFPAKQLVSALRDGEIVVDFFAGGGGASEALRVITTARGGDMAVAEPVVVGYSIDILYRMLVERELFNAQGFPRDYVIDRTASGQRITRGAAIRMVGNSVSPPPLCALARANLDMAEQRERAAA